MNEKNPEESAEEVRADWHEGQAAEKSAPTFQLLLSHVHFSMNSVAASE